MRKSDGLRRLLDDVAAAHHGDRVGDVVDHREIVRDEQVGQAEGALQVLEEVEHLCLHRDVERRDRLVAEQHLRVQRKGAGDAETLALAAGKRVRIAPQGALIEADHVEQLLGPPVALVGRADAVDEQRLGE